MKTLILITLILLAGCSKEPVIAQEVNLKIIAQIESSGNPEAYNKSSGAVGMFQITPICLKDYNQAHKRHYQLSEMFDPLKAEKVASWYLKQRIPALLKHYGKADTLVNRLIAYNAGIKAVIKGYCPDETRNYIKKYQRLATLVY